MVHLSAYIAHHPVGVLILVAFACILLALLRSLGSNGAPPPPIAKPFLTRREMAMLGALEQVLPMYRVHAQVAMGALLKATPRLGRRSSPADRNSFAQKIIDFLIFDPATGRVVALGELDDRNHDAVKDRARDQMTARAGYETIRIPASARPTVPTAQAALAHLVADARFDAGVMAEGGSHGAR